MNPDDPAARRALVERLGSAAPNVALEAHQKASTVNGYQIRQVPSRHGQVYQVVGTGLTCGSRELAEACARSLPARLQFFLGSVQGL
jgi:hypothetical protein